MAINLNGTTGITTTGLTSNGIDDNATSTAMTLDSSGNLLVGTTDNANTRYTATSGGGTVIQASSFSVFSRETTASNQAVMTINNTGVDAIFTEFLKDGSTVGSIGSRAGEDLYIGSGDTFAKFVRSVDAIVPANADGSLRDNAINLGALTGRFKDLYLSGGVYLGGTGSANKLDDYEEGTWTPILDNVTVTYSTQNGTYTKIGNLVSARFEIGVASLDTTDPSGLRVGGLPFIVSDSGCLFTMDTENSSVITNKPNILGARPIVSASAVMLTQNGSVFTYNSGTASSGSLIGMVQYYA